MLQSPGAGRKMLVALGGFGVRWLSGDYADFLFQPQWFINSTQKQTLRKIILVCHREQYSNLNQSAILKMIKDGQHTQCSYLGNSRGQQSPNYPNSQNVNPEGMQKVCLAWYSQQARALRTLGLTGLKTVSSEPGKFPSGHTTQCLALPWRESRDREEDKHSAWTTKRPWNYFKGNRKIEDLQAPFSPRLHSCQRNNIWRDRRRSPSLLLLPHGFLLQIGDGETSREFYP